MTTEFSSGRPFLQGETTPCPYKAVQNLNRVACETRHDGNI